MEKVKFVATNDLYTNFELFGEIESQDLNCFLDYQIKKIDNAGKSKIRVTHNELDNLIKLLNLLNLEKEKYEKEVCNENEFNEDFYEFSYIMESGDQFDTRIIIYYNSKIYIFDKN